MHQVVLYDGDIEVVTAIETAQQATAVQEPWNITALVPSIGTSDYNMLQHKPCIEGVELVGDKAFTDLGMSGSESIGFDHGEISAIELTAAETAALLTDD